MARGSFIFFINKILFNLKKVVMRTSSSMVFRWHVRRCSATKLWPPWRCFNHHNIASIPMRWVWQKYVRFCAGDLLFSSFFPFSSSVLKPTVTHYQSNLLIYFSFGFNLFFYCYLFYFRLSIQLRFSFNLIFFFFSFQIWSLLFWLLFF
jgi:hypothetical protein